MASPTKVAGMRPKAFPVAPARSTGNTQGADMQQRIGALKAAGQSYRTGKPIATPKPAPNRNLTMPVRPLNRPRSVKNIMDTPDNRAKIQQDRQSFLPKPAVGETAAKKERLSGEQSSRADMVARIKAAGLSPGRRRKRKVSDAMRRTSKRTP